MDSINRRFGILCLVVATTALAACATNNVSQCEATGVLCPSGMHCAAAQPICIADTNLCGNAHMDPGEVCDDGNTKDGDDCSHDCTSNLKCGNGIVDLGAKVPEQCDDGDLNGQLGDPCSSTCQFVRCGNFVVEQGEQCDDGNIDSGDGCSSTCQSEFCGNSHIDPGEVCDDGDKNGTPGDKCSANCRSNLSCNNHIVDQGEECDNGTFGPGNMQGNSDSNDCRSDCQFNRCGDGFVDNQTGGRKEQCDGGHLNGLIPVPTETASCNIDCTTPSCGDHKINRSFTPTGAAGPEQCDDGNANNNNADCTALCQINVCGDGHQDMAPGPHQEDCDDGAMNGSTNDPCTKDCHLVSCGNGTLDANEECDDGANNGTGKRCNMHCKFNVCGDGDTRSDVEQCDDGTGGTPKDSATCDHDCTFAVCGDGYQNTMAGEECDDGAGNGKAPSMCSFTCKTIHCGNGVLEQGEQCDDGMANNGAGKRCNTSCQLNVCGDNDTLVGVEQCDKGTADTTTCDADCTFAVCGDGHKNMAAGEACDEGPANGTAASTCDAFCKIKGCGNGIVEPGEQCDPGLPGVDSATCNFDCTLPTCGDGHQNTLAGEACDDGAANGTPCDYNDHTCQRCNTTCTAKISPGGPFCGDAQIDGTATHPEVCDQGPLNGALCAYGDTSCLTNANSLCKADCSGFAGALHGPFCGDGTVQSAFEDCDPGGNTPAPVDTAQCNNDCTFPVCGDGHVNSHANEACDDRNSSTCGTCSADCTTVTLAAAAGRIVTAGGGNITPTDTFTLSDGFGSNTYEFVLATGTPGAGHIGIVFTAGDTAATVATAIIAVVTARGTVAITAAAGSGGTTVNLTNRRATSHGNQPFSPTGMIATSFTFSTSGSPPVAGMSGGQGGDCDAGIGCSVDNDCTSAKCTRNRCVTCVGNADCGTGRTCSNGVCSQLP
ncbi:MAG TPA: hypothetical protein VHW23_05335 [Kofleriaceae bacterium]|jgi:cysteine-rich repeat protein|nr:hypothetical protein [Kofleriaceae bacterium]